MPATLPSWAAAVAGDWRPDLAGRAARGGARAGRRGYLHSERADAGPLLVRTARHIRQRRGSARADRPAAKLARHRQRHGRGPRNAAIRRAGAGRDRQRHGLRWAYQGPDAVSWRPSLRRRRSHCLLGILNRHSGGNDSRPHPHREGAGLLQSYNCVLTGSHPEYHTPETLDALQQHVGDGGRLCYPGGNGFYWRIAASAAMPDVLEARRAKGGIRAWDAGPGEAYHQLDGCYGGLRRRNGQPPQLLAGVGFSAQGLFEGSYYRLLPAAREPAIAWITEGIKGDYGLSGGGAAGFELDRADERLGTPSNTLIIAHSEAHQAHFMAIPEVPLSHINIVTGERPSDLVRAEIVYFETTNGVVVFSTGSITSWAAFGAPGHDKLGYDNPAATMLGNVIRQFARS
jgi:hypothetical protein